MTPPPEAVITATADAPPPPASVPVEADGSPPERLVETQTSLRREAEAAVRATELAKLANEPPPSTPTTTQPDQTELIVEPPAPPQPDQTQVAVEPSAPPPNDQTQLVVEPPAPPPPDQTQLAVEPPAPPPPDQTQLAVEPPAPPPPDQTQLVVEPPAPPRPDQTQVAVAPPNQTQLMVEPPAPPPSTGELMETILEGGTPATVPPQAPDDEDDTQFVQMPATPTSAAPTAAPSGFEALAMDPVATKAPTPAEVITMQSVQAPVRKLGETTESLTGIEADPAPLEAGFMESFAAEPPLETAKVPKMPHTQELDLDPDGIEKVLGDD